MALKEFQDLCQNNIVLIATNKHLTGCLYKQRRGMKSGPLTPICLPTSSHLGQSGGEVAGLPLQENHPDCSGVAQHALVLGSSGHVQPNPIEPAELAHTIIQSDSTQESVKPKSACVAPRASAIKSQGFSEAVAAQIEAPQRGSTKSVYEAVGHFLQSGASVIRASPIKSVADVPVSGQEVTAQYH